MAGEVSRLYILFDADGKPYIKGLKDIEGQTHKSASTMEQRFAQAGGKIQAGLGLAVAAVAAAAVAMGAAVIKSAADFEYEMSRIKANANGSAAEMQALQSEVIQLGKDTVFSASQAAGAANELVKAGLSIGETMSALPGMLALASAGELDVARAATITANQLSVFGLKASDASKVADTLALTANKSTTEVSLLADSLAMVGSVAAQAGLTLEQTSAALALLANNGLKGSDAGTSLKQMFMQLEGPSDKARQLMDDYGISAYDASGNMLDFGQILTSVNDGLVGTTQQERDFALATIFGSDAVRAANILLKEGAAGFAAMTEEVSKTGAAEEIAATKMDNLKGSWEQLKGSIQTLSIVLGTEGIPGLREFVDGLTEETNRFLEQVEKLTASDVWKSGTVEVKFDLISKLTMGELQRLADKLTTAMLHVNWMQVGSTLGEVVANLAGAAMKVVLAGVIPALPGLIGGIVKGVALGVADMAKDVVVPSSQARGTSRVATSGRSRAAAAERSQAAISNRAAQAESDDAETMTLLKNANARREATTRAEEHAHAQDVVALATQRATAATEEQTAMLESYSSALDSVIQSDLDPAQIWRDAKGSLDAYLKSLATHKRAFQDYQTNLDGLFAKYGPEYGSSVMLKLFDLTPPELAQLKASGEEGVRAYLDAAKYQLDADSPEYQQHLIDLCKVDMSQNGVEAFTTYKKGWLDSREVLEAQSGTDHKHDGSVAFGTYKAGWLDARETLAANTKDDFHSQGTLAWKHFADGWNDSKGVLWATTHTTGGTQKYDAGGYIQPGINVVANYTGKPEPVLTAGQWESIQALVAGTARPSMDTAGPSTSGAEIVRAVQSLQSTTADLAEAFKRSLVAAEELRLQHERQRG